MSLYQLYIPYTNSNQIYQFITLKNKRKKKWALLLSRLPKKKKRKFIFYVINLWLHPTSLKDTSHSCDLGYFAKNPS